jgi:hypothetical protein
MHAASFQLLNAASRLGEGSIPVFKIVSTVIIDGYGSGETDFLTQLDRVPDSVRDEFNNLIFFRLIEVWNTNDQTAVLSMEGHSDRVDTDGLSREQRRLEELSASVNRVNSAGDGIFQLLANHFGPGFPADWADLSQIGVGFAASGGAVLLHSSPSLSDAQRRANRRVVLHLTSFVP